MARFDLRQYARNGAQARAAELRKELAAIYKAFPELRRAEGTRGNTGGGRRKPMSAAQRKAVSARMKKYWASRRKANA